MKSHKPVFQIKYKETYMKDKEKAVGINMSDSKTLHSLQVAKMSSDVSSSCFFLIGLKVFMFCFFFLPKKRKEILPLTFIVDA